MKNEKKKSRNIHCGANIIIITYTYCKVQLLSYIYIYIVRNHLETSIGANNIIVYIYCIPTTEEIF